MKMQLISENSSQVKVEPPKGDPSKKLPVFYNPVMRSNRNISVLLLNSIAKKDLRIALPMAGSGIRALRFLQEVKGVGETHVNDIKENFISYFKENLKLNNIKIKVNIHNEDASLFLLKKDYFDYIDLDPFGSPNPFLAATIARISREGILAVTATDTAALTGTYLKATKRKYWATSLKNYMMHETGLRILIRKVQLQGMQFDKALVPVLSYYKDHYFRIYFVSSSGKDKCDQIIKQHQYLHYCSKCLNYETSYENIGKCDCGNKFAVAGPLWTGKLHNFKLIKKMARNNPFPEEQKFLDILANEKDLFGFYDLHQIAKIYKLKVPKIKSVLEKLEASRTHFKSNGLKTNKGIKEIIKNLKLLLD